MARVSNCWIFIFNYVSVFLFFKKKIKSAEIGFFSAMIVGNITLCFFDIISTSLALFDKYNLFLNIVSKLYLVNMIFVICIFLYYIIYITTTKENIISKKNVKKFTIFVSILSLGCLILPLYNFSDNGIVYTYGPSATLSKVVAIVSFIVSFLLFIKEFRNIKTKKYIPLIFYILFMALAGCLQFLWPSVLIITFVLIFVTFLMHFTIENPDLKMIEQLEIAKEAAEKANSAKTDFLSNMSHEIRTPLNAIVGFSQGLLEEDLNESAKEEVTDIINASHNLLDIVNGILDISKIEANKLEIVNTEYNFNKLFDEVVSLTKGRIGEKPLEFRYKYDESIPPVLYGDYIRIKQIIVNLLTNAVKYTKRGFIELKVSSVKKDDICRIIVSVEDSGIGIKEENIDKLFSKFERFDLENNITIEGTGLGLAITKRLVELMNGKIVVQSKYGEGSRFTVAIDQRVIPKTLEELIMESANNTFDNTEFIGTGNKILVVDDNNINLKVAARLLRSYDVDIDLVSSGKECIDMILANKKYDLILLDDMMPKMTGIETLANLKKIIGFNIPTVALTANAISGMREKYLECGFDDYLSKPIDKIKLEVVLRKFLKNHNINEPMTNNVTESVNNNIVEEVNVNINNNIELLISNGVNVDSGIELLGDIETYNETLATFLNEIDERLANIESYRVINDMPNYAILVHAMKSDAKYLGFTKLAELSYNHEMASKANDINYVNSNYNELITEATRITSLVRKYLKDNENNGTI